MLIRIRKVDIPPRPIDSPDGVSYCLSCWKSWMQQKGDRDLGAKTMRGLQGEGDGYGETSVHDAQQANDNRVGAATDAAIDSLKNLHKWAIYNMCSIASPWRYTADILHIGPVAMDALKAKLKDNCCTGALVR